MLLAHTGFLIVRIQLTVKVTADVTCDPTGMCVAASERFQSVNFKRRLLSSEKQEQHARWRRCPDDHGIQHVTQH